MFNWKATEKYTKIPKTVIISKKRCAEPGEPNKSLLFAKLERPIDSRGIRIRIITIKNKLVHIPRIVNINLMG